MLLGDFYNIDNTVKNEENEIEVVVHFNKDHDIFKGHFPEFPIVPGVVMLQIIKEILVHFKKRSLQLINADTIKFLRFIEPGVHEKVGVNIISRELENKQSKIIAYIRNSEDTFLKFKGIFKLIDK